MIEENTLKGMIVLTERHLETVHDNIFKKKDLTSIGEAFTQNSCLPDAMVVGPFKSFEEAANYMEAMKVGASIDLDISTSEMDILYNGIEDNHQVFSSKQYRVARYIEVLFQYRESVMKTARTLLGFLRSARCSLQGAC